MLEPWNDPSILPPSINTFFCHGNISIKQMSLTCSNIIRILSKQLPLHAESAILSRFVYKFDKKLRNDIGYRAFKKVNTALKKYLVLNLMRDIESFAAVLPSKDECYLPTRQMLEYVLVRLITFSKLMLRIVVCSKQAAVFYLDRVRRGESHWMSLMPYALLSRIWSMSTVLLQHCCDWYGNLHPFLSKLELKGMDFLRSEYTLPEDLQRWLDMDNLDNFGKLEWKQKKVITVDPSLIEDDGGEFESILHFVNNINNEVYTDEDTCVKYSTEEIVAGPLFENTVKQFDHGEKISRESFYKSDTVKQIDQGEKISRESYKRFTAPTINIKDAKPTKASSHCIENVTSLNALTEFIQKEEEFRNNNSEKALSGHLSFMQWQALKTNLLKLCKPLSNNRKIERKFQKIWKIKCVDYQ